MKRFIAPLAVGIVALYLTLVLGVAACLFDHAEQFSPSHHHAQSHSAHSAFCVWACQANSSFVTFSTAPSTTNLSFVSLLDFFVPIVFVCNAADNSLSRAPPSFL